MRNEKDRLTLVEARKNADIGIYSLGFSIKLRGELDEAGLDLQQPIGDFLADIANQTIAEAPKDINIIAAYKSGHPQTEKYSAISRLGLDLLIERMGSIPAEDIPSIK